MEILEVAVFVFVVVVVLVLVYVVVSYRAADIWTKKTVDCFRVRRCLKLDMTK